MLMMFSSESFAQTQNQAAAAPANTLGEIVVTARRVEENQQRVPIAVTSLSGGQLTQRNVTTVTNLQFSVPNLQIRPGALSPENTEFIIRGQRKQLFTDENTVVYFDGVPRRERGITLYDLQNVQVLRGPQGTLFGKNSVGGAVVFTTNRPTFERSGTLTMDVGNYDLWHATGVLNIPVIDDKLAVRLAGDVERRDGVFKNVNPNGQNMGNRHHESFRASFLAKPTSNLENLTVVDYYHAVELPTPAVLEAAPLHAAGFGALVSLLTQQEVQRQSLIGGGTAVVNGNVLQRTGSPYVVDRYTGHTTLGTPVLTPLGPVTPRFPLFADVKAYGVSNTTTVELSKTLSFRNIFGWRYELGDETQDPSGGLGMTVNLAPFLTGLGVPGLPANVPGDFVNLVPRDYEENKDITDEMQLIYKSDSLSGIMGAYYQHNRFNYRTTSWFQAGPISLYPAPTRYYNTIVPSDSYAVFAQGTYDFSQVGVDGLRLTLGVRQSWDKRAVTNNLHYSNNYTQLDQQWPDVPNGICATVAGQGSVATGYNSPTQCFLEGSKAFKALTWTASLEYQVNPKTLVYFANRRGYKAGGVNPTTANLDFTFFGPERLTDFEVGLKHEGSIGDDRPYRLNVAAFYGKYKRIQTQAIIPFCVTDACTASYTDLIIFNVGQADIKGIELEGTFKPTPELTFDAGYSYQYGSYGANSIIPQPRNITAPVSSTNPIDYSSGVNLEGREFAGIPRHTVNLSMTYAPTFVPENIGKPSMNINWAWRNKTLGDSNLGVAPTAAFGVLNARLTLRDVRETRVSVALWAQNLLNTAYQLNCLDNTSIGYTSCHWGDPRTYGLTASVDF